MKKISPAPNIRHEFDKGGISGDIDFDLVKKYNEKYYHWEEIKYRIENEGTRKKVWTFMKITRMANAKYLNIGGVACSYSLTSNTLESLFDLERSLSGHMEYHAKEIGNERMRYHAVSSFIEEAISSSILEGAAVTRADAKRMIRKKQPPTTKGERMVMNNYLAMENIKRSKDEKLTPDLIKELHRTISSGTLDGGEKWEGRFREDDEVVVGDSQDPDKVYHIPPPHHKVPGMIEGLCKFCNEDGAEYMPPLIKGIIIHFMIGYIHPFIDGNGRLARSLFYWYAIKKGYWMMEYAAISRSIRSAPSRYGMAYQFVETDENDLTYFIRFNIDQIKRAIKALEEHIENKIKEQKAVRDFVNQNSQLNIRQAMMLKDYMKDDAPFSIMELKQRYRCAYQTARLDVMALESMGLIRAVGKDRKKALYIVDAEEMYKHAEEKTQKDAEEKKTPGPKRKDPMQSTLPV